MSIMMQLLSRLLDLHFIFTGCDPTRIKPEHRAEYDEYQDLLKQVDYALVGQKNSQAVINLLQHDLAREKEIRKKINDEITRITKPESLVLPHDSYDGSCIHGDNNSLKTELVAYLEKLNDNNSGT